MSVKYPKKVRDECLKALKNARGIISTACDAVKISRGTFYVWLEKYPDFKESVEEIAERTGDFVEGKLLEKIEKGDTIGVIFYCKTKLKNRGYIERSEVTGKDGADLIKEPTAADKAIVASAFIKEDGD